MLGLVNKSARVDAGGDILTCVSQLSDVRLADRAFLELRVVVPSSLQPGLRFGRQERERDDLHVRVHQRAARQGAVLLEVQELSHPLLLHENSPAALQGPQAEGDLLLADDREQAVVQRILHDNLRVTHGANLPEQDLVRAVAVLRARLRLVHGDRLVQCMPEVPIVVLAFSHSRVWDAGQFLRERLAVEASLLPCRGHQQGEDVRNDADAPALRQYADLALLAVRIEGQQGIRGLVLVAGAERASALVLREVRRLWQGALDDVLVLLLCLPAGGVQGPPPGGQALPQHAELLLLLDVAIEPLPEPLQAFLNHVLLGLHVTVLGERDRRSFPVACAGVRLRQCSLDLGCSEVVSGPPPHHLGDVRVPRHGPVVGAPLRRRRHRRAADGNKHGATCSGVCLT
mmetsp:Transcript_72660/g.210356  ORF Transcript_72660/g.210356 Transcript_72660/m.210356 type:complete len:401 (-) Transcript_72660:173-1375(-)